MRMDDEKGREEVCFYLMKSLRQQLYEDGRSGKLSFRNNKNDGKVSFRNNRNRLNMFFLTNKYAMFLLFGKNKCIFAASKK